MAELGKDRVPNKSAGWGSPNSVLILALIPMVSNRYIEIAYSKQQAALWDTLSHRSHCVLILKFLYPRHLESSARFAPLIFNYQVTNLPNYPISLPSHLEQALHSIPGFGGSARPRCQCCFQSLNGLCMTAGGRCDS
jgi:hypothetical protein